MICLHCGAETSNGLALCDLCQRFAASVFELLPIYFRNLARWRPGRSGTSRPVPGSRVLYDGMPRGGDRVSRALDEAGTELVGWAEVLADDRPEIRWPLDLADLTETEQAIRLCEIFAERLVTVATLEWGGEFVRKVSGHEEVLRGLTEQSVPGWYAGSCGRRVSMEGATCGAATYVVPGLTWVTCATCGNTTHAAAHLDVILDEARGWVATPKQLAQAVVAMIDTEESVEGLRKRIAIWGNRDKLEVHRPNGYSIKRYRLGDVLDLLAKKGATRTDLLPLEADAC